MADIDFWSGAAGAVLGSVVGGAIGFVGQWITIRDVRKTRKEDRDTERKALGYSLLFKAMRIHSNIAQIDQYFKESAAQVNLQDPPQIEIWQYLVPLANLPEKIRFSPEEMGMLLSLKDNKLFNEIMVMDLVHNSQIEALSTYNAKYAELAGKTKPVAMVGPVGKLEFDGDAFMEVRPHMVAVNSLGSQIGMFAARDEKTFGEVLDRLALLLRDKLKLSIKLEMKKAI